MTTTTTTTIFTAKIQVNLFCQHLQLRTEDDFVGAKYYCLHALADGNQRIWIREKRLEFSSTVLSTLSLYPEVEENAISTDHVWYRLSRIIFGVKL